MNFFHNIASSPALTGIATTLVVFVYFILMVFNPNLPPALIFSAVIGYFVYLMRKDSGQLEHLSTQGSSKQGYNIGFNPEIPLTLNLPIINDTESQMKERNIL